MYTFWSLFVAFFRANIVTFGGGPTSIPLIRKEVVDVYGWMTNEEFANVIAVGNSLPGPIATKLAASIGYQVGGITGAIISIIATVGPTALLMTVLFAFMMKYKDTKVIKGIMIAIQPVIVVLLIQVAYEMGKGTLNNISILLIGIFLLSLIAVFYFKIHPAIIIILAIFIGAIFSEFII
jgi:chromate transporter